MPYLAETLRARPGTWKAVQAMARIQLELGRDKEALASFQRVIAMKSDYPPAFVGAGEVYAKQDGPANARRMFQRALELDPKCADAMNQLGLLAAGANDLHLARGSGSSRRLKRSRDHPGAINNLGVLYAKMGQPNDSIAAFRYGIKMNPDDDELYLNLARIYVTMGQREKARAVLNELLEQKPGNRDGDQGAGGIGGKMILLIVLLIEAMALIGTRGGHERTAFGKIIAAGADCARSAAGIELPLFRCSRPGPLRQPGTDDRRCRPLGRCFCSSGLTSFAARMALRPDESRRGWHRGLSSRRL